MDTIEAPDMSRTTSRIEFIKCLKGEAKRTQRPMPEQLNGVLTENDFETFCNKIDLLLQLYHESEAVKDFKMRVMRKMIYMHYFICFLGLGLYFLPLPDTALVAFLTTVAVVGLIPASFFGAAIALAICMFDRGPLCHFYQILAECSELTNRTGNAIFRLKAELYDKPGKGDHSGLMLCHINVLLKNVV